MINRDIEKEMKLASQDYHNTFWNVLRDANGNANNIAGKLRHIHTGAYDLPTSSLAKLEAKLANKSNFRKLCTVVKAHSQSSKLFIYEGTPFTKWMKDYDANIMTHMPIKDGFKRIDVTDYTLVNLIRLGTDFTADLDFDIEEFITSELTKQFTLSESEAFINGDGITKPTGILSDTSGAEVAVQAKEISADTIKHLFFSLDSKYRENATWLMNDETALYLQTLKDTTGAYILPDFDGNLMGRPVVIDNAMPSSQKGAKVIAFG
ncbi:TPA: phage major capsid protein, partial [Streptococcus agalactiae]